MVFASSYLDLVVVVRLENFLLPSLFDVMRYLCSNSVISGVFFYIFTVSIVRESTADHVQFPNQYFQNGYSYYPTQYTQRAQPQLPSRSSRGIPIDLAMKLNSITDETELFEQYIENGHNLLETTFAANTARASRRSFDAEEFSTGGSSSGARVGRVADARNIPRDTEIEPHQTVHVASLSAVSSRSANRQATRPSSTDENTLDDTPPRVFYAETAPKIPRPAICEPESRTVSLKDIEDPTFFYYPSCTRVKRCGGCCAHDLLSCQPKMLQYTNYTVNVSKYNGKDKLTYFGKKTITVEEHLNCSCQCKVKSRDCSPQQRYEKQNCRCVCKNEEDEVECTKEQSIKLWNPATCSCQCRDRIECSSGYYFDRDICKCVPSQKPTNLLIPDYTIDRTGYRMNYEPPF